MKISVVIPMYGCKKAIPELHRRLTAALTGITTDYEIIMVNDACPQDSWSAIAQLCSEDSHVIGVELSRNFGQMKAILAGLDICSGDWVVVMDCDLQDRPEEIPNLYAKAQEGYDVVFARRETRKDSKAKVFVSNCFYKVYSYATGIAYDGGICNFSISRRTVIENYCKMREAHRGFVMYIQWMGFRQAVINVRHEERYDGVSGYNFRKRMNMALELLTSQSDKILRLTAKLGFCIAVLSLLFILISVVQYFMLHIQAGWTSLIASIMLMGGLTIFSIGVTGIYIGNIFMEVKQRPLYIVRQQLNGQKETDCKKTAASGLTGV